MCMFNAVKKQSGISFVVDALFGSRTAYKLCIDTFWKPGRPSGLIYF